MGNIERPKEPSPLAKARAEGTSGPTMEQLLAALTRGESEVESLRRQLAGAVEALERLLREIEGRPEGWQGPGTVQDFIRDALNQPGGQ